MVWQNGIDSFAHQKAIEISGKTIAVLGSGFNKIFPPENEILFQKIIENNGLVISEYAPNVEAISSNFPERNRIVSGLSDAVLVIEAAYVSGTSITASIAKSQGKKVFCIPRNLDESKGIGTNRLIKKGAKLVMEVDDILQELHIEKKKNINVKRLVPEEYKEIYNAIGEEIMDINQICRKLNTSVSQINAILMMMEIEGYIKACPGNNFERI